MSELTIAREVVYSSLGTDPDLGELVELFVSEVPDRIAMLEKAWAARDLEALGCAAHQLKGAAGSYGFEGLTPSLHRLDSSVRGQQAEEEISAALTDVIETCLRVRAGAPDQ